MTEKSFISRYLPSDVGSYTAHQFRYFNTLPLRHLAMSGTGNRIENLLVGADRSTVFA